MYLGNVSKDSFEGNQKLKDSVVRRLEIIGEAVKNIPDDFRKKYPEIPWQKVAGMRDVIIHGYFRVDLETVWSVIKKDLPDLKDKIIGIKKDLNNNIG